MTAAHTDFTRREIQASNQKKLKFLKSVFGKIRRHTLRNEGVNLRILKQMDLCGLVMYI
jgi:hypothetical protein